MFARFLTAILRLLRILPAYPIFGDGRTRLQPAYADDIAAAITQIVRQSKKPYPIYELAGPRVYSYEELVRTIARIAGLRPVLMRTPFAFWGALAGLAEILPHPPLTRNQVELMQIDTTASENFPGFRELGISPRSLEEELKAMLKQSDEDTQLPKTLDPASSNPSLTCNSPSTASSPRPTPILNPSSGPPIQSASSPPSSAGSKCWSQSTSM